MAEDQSMVAIAIPGDLGWNIDHMNFFGLKFWVDEFVEHLRILKSQS